MVEEPAASVASVSARESATPAAPPGRRFGARAEEQLRKHEDSRQRDELKATRAAALREQSMAAAKRVGLTRDELDRAASTLAELGLQREEARLRCVVTGSCDARQAGERDPALERQALAQTIGADKAERFLDFQFSSLERGQVQRFNDRLPKEHELSEAQSEQLVSTLAAYRREIEVAGRADGQRYGNVFTSGGLSLAVPNGPDVPLDDKLRAIDDSRKKVRERVAPILSAAQLEAYDEAQQFAVDGAKRMLQEQARRRAGARSGGGG